MKPNVPKGLKEHIPTADERNALRALFRKLKRMHAKAPASKQVFPSTEEMLREDRGR